MPVRRPGRESAAARALRALDILERLRAEYPDAHCELNYTSPFELLAATILSAQCTDVRVNLVTPELFRRWPDAFALAAASQEDVEDVIRSTGFFRNKARSLLGMARALVADHDGVVPQSMDELRTLPGVGRKTANVVLGNAYQMQEGVTVDTHVLRLSQLLRLTRESDPEKVERDLIKLIPRADWALISHLMIWHGRRVCIANRPKCGICVVAGLCPSEKREARGERRRTTGDDAEA